MTKINYFNISWISDEDGPGKRLVLFLQKCHLDCAWCHSPHSIGERSPLLFFSNLCTKCGNCIDACPSNVHSIKNNLHIIDRSSCIHCGKCIEVCPSSNEESGALVLPTRSINVVELYRKIRSQLIMLKEIGGITISGGEPLLQVEAVKEILKLCKKDHIHTVVETSGINPLNDYRVISPFVDCWLIGFRLITKKGKINKNLFRTSTRTLEYLAKLPNVDIIARIPVIPNHTAYNEYYEKVLELLNTYSIKEIGLLKYNKHTSHYYNAIGQSINDQEMLSLAQEKYHHAKTFFLTHNIKLYENRIERKQYETH